MKECLSVASRVTKTIKVNLPNFSKSSQTVLNLIKCQNIYIEAQSESPKHLHLTTFETLKYLQ